MTFTLDRTRTFLKIDECNLISIHQSTHQAVPNDGCSCGRPCDAFICVTREYNLLRVYAVLYDSQLKSNLVFVTNPVGPDNQKLEVIVQEAETHLETLGFSMEPVNLAFSPATREVILRGTKVMREPSLEIRLQAALAMTDLLMAEKNKLAREAAQDHRLMVAELEKLRGQLTSAEKFEGGDAVKSNLAAEQPDSILVSADENRFDELAAVRREVETLRGEIFQLQAANHKLQKSGRTAEAKIKSRQDKLRITVVELRNARQEKRAFLGQMETARELLTAAETEARELREELESVRQAIKSREGAAAVFTEANEALTMENAALKEEVARLRLDREATTAAVSGELQALRAALLMSDEKVRGEHAKNESALQEMDALERNAAIELKSLKKKVDSLIAEKHKIQSMAAELRLKSAGEIERLQKENHTQRHAAINKISTLKEEMRQLSDARVGMTAPFGLSPTKPVRFGKEGMSPPPTDKALSVAEEATSETYTRLNPFEDHGFSENVYFEPDTTLPGIPYAESGDVVEAYRSFNKVQAAPDGNQVQSCDAFVCLVKSSGKSTVYVAWLMNETEEVLVCRPAGAGDGDNPRHLLGEGIGYFERIGFLMDRLELEADSGRRGCQIDALPVFHRVVMVAAA